MAGWPLCARLCAHPEISPESKFCADSTKVLWMRLINRGPPCLYACKKITLTLKILQSMSEFGGLWKQQNNPACTKNDGNGQLCGQWSLTEEEEKALINKCATVSTDQAFSPGPAWQAGQFQTEQRGDPHCPRWAEERLSSGHSRVRH